MSGFSADWLHLREPFDHHARQAALADPRWLAAWASHVARLRQAGHPGTLSVTDLACGSGSNLRLLAPKLGGRQRWRLVDHDPALLAAVPAALAAWARREGHACEIAPGSQGGGRTQAQGDARPDAPPTGVIHLAGRGFEAEVHLVRLDLAGQLAQLDFTQTDLVTASALLDLVSDSWLRALIRQARQAGAAMLFALSVDGRTEWTPTDPLDAEVDALFTAHQRRDKGFGVALGAEAVARAVQGMREAGYAVAQAQSDWAIDACQSSATGGDASAMLAAMTEGMAQVAREQAPLGGTWPPSAMPAISTTSATQAIDAWQARRMACIDATRLTVGHVDLLATLP